MLRLLVLVIVFSIKANAQKVEYEQIAFDYFFDSVFVNDYPNVKVISFNGLTETELTSFKRYCSCFLNEDAIRNKLAQTSFKKTLEAKSLNLATTSRIKFKKVKKRSGKHLKMHVYLANELGDKVYIRLELYKRYYYTNSYMFELYKNGNVIRWCKTGVVH